MNLVFRAHRSLVFSSVLLASLPVLSIYNLLSERLSLADIAMVMIIFVSIATSVFSCSRADMTCSLARPHCWFLLFFSICFVLACISAIIRGQQSMVIFARRWIRLIISLYIIDISSRTQFSRKVLCNVIMVLGIVLSGLLILQELLDALFNIQLYPYLRISFLPMDYGDVDVLIARQRTWRNAGGGRYSSVFPEPAYFAQFALLPMAVSMFESGDLFHDQKRVLCVFLTTVAILLGRSANGLFVALPLWLVFVLMQFKRGAKAEHLFLIALCGVVGIIVVVETGMLEKAWARVLTVKRGSASTGTLRLLQGIEVFKQLPPLAKWFGIGFGNVNSFLVENSITTIYSNNIGNEYMNGFSTVLVSSGIIGFLFYMLIWFGMFFENRYLVNRMIWLVISMLMCTSAIFYSPILVVYLVFIRCKEPDHVSVCKS